MSVAAWLPFLYTPLTPDESGFLVLSQHWTSGTSLYGNYWVDRPPLMLWLFSLAGHLGPISYSTVGVSAPAVKLVGAAASGVAVLLTGLLTRVIAPGCRGSHRAAVVLIVALLSNPLLGMPETDGELLAVPFVLLGLTCLITALRNPWGRSAFLFAAGAGGAAMSAALVKQNVVDVFVFALVAGVTARGRVTRLGSRAGAFAAGAITMLAVVVAAAAARGTSLSGLWDAVVVFRFHASAVISSSASEATPRRMSNLGQAFLASGAAAVLVVTVTILAVRVLRGRRAGADAVLARDLSPHHLIWPALALVAWELCGVVLGGSYWPHYLTGLVPGLVLLVSLTRPARGRPLLLTACLTYTVAASLTVWTQHVTEPITTSPDAQVETYLRGHAARSDGVVVAFGHPDIVLGSRLNSPYLHLWSLPVRVRDPRLKGLQRVLSGPESPRWLVLAGESLGSWGLDAQSAQKYLQRHYVEQASYGEWHIWQREEQQQGAND